MGEIRLKAPVARDASSGEDRTNAIVKPSDLNSGGRLADLTVGLNGAEEGRLRSLAREGKLTDDAVGQARELAARQHDAGKVAPGQLLVISDKFGVVVPVASALADIATGGENKLEQGRVTKMFTEACNALARNGQENEHLQEDFKRMSLDRQLKLIQDIGELAGIAKDFEVNLRPVVKLYTHYGEVGSVKDAVERCSDIADSQPSEREVATSTVINRLLGALRNAEACGSSTHQVERFLDEGDYRSLVRLSSKRGLAE